jgi:hypothetical protein
MATIDALATQVPSPGGGTTSTSFGFGVVGVIGSALLLALEIFIAIKDGRSFFTLYGKIRWKPMNVVLKNLLGFLYLGGWIMTPIYLVMAIRHHLRVRRQTLGQSLQSGWRGYNAKKTSTKVGLGLVCAFLILTFALIISVGAMADRNMALGLLTPTASPQQAITPADTPVLNAVDTQVATTAPTKPPTSAPAPKPTPQPTQRLTTAPTQPSKPPTCPGLNCNPWGYNFTPGTYIYYPPTGFCNYFACIPSFYGPDDPGDGSIVECQDSSYSQSGGERGACSFHGGELRPLYSH